MVMDQTGTVAAVELGIGNHTANFTLSITQWRWKPSTSGWRLQPSFPKLVVLTPNTQPSWLRVNATEAWSMQVGELHRVQLDCVAGSCVLARKSDGAFIYRIFLEDPNNTPGTTAAPPITAQTTVWSSLTPPNPGFPVSLTQLRNYADGLAGGSLSYQLLSMTPRLVFG